MFEFFACINFDVSYSTKATIVSANQSQLTHSLQNRLMDLTLQKTASDWILCRIASFPFEVIKISLMIVAAIQDLFAALTTAK